MVMATCSASHAQVSLLGRGDEKETFEVHQKNNLLVGGGLTMLGLTAKAGGFVGKRWWVGAEGELHNLLSTRREIGLFTRYYTGERLFNAFIGAGASYGRFQAWNWDFDRVLPTPPVHHSTKLNALIGLELRISKRFSVEGVAKAGQLTTTNWLQPSFQGSVNYYIGR